MRLEQSRRGSRCSGFSPQLCISGGCSYWSELRTWIVADDPGRAHSPLLRPWLLCAHRRRGWLGQRRERLAGFHELGRVQRHEGGFFRRGAAKQESQRFKLGGLSSRATYTVEFYGGPKIAVKGSELQNWGCTLGPRAFQLIFRNVNGSHFTIDGGVELVLDMQRRVL